MNNMFAATTLAASVGNVRFDVYTYVPDIRRSERIEDPLIHMHYSEEFFYIFEGTVKLSIADGKRSVTLKKGDLCMIPSGMYHCAYSTDTERLCFEARITVDEKATDTVSEHYRNIARTSRELDMPFVVNSPYVETSMERYRKLSELGGASFDASGMAVLLGVVMYALDNLKSSKKAACATEAADALDDERKRVIERFIAEHFGNSCCLSMLSSALCLSERRTSSVVREIMHKSFKELIIEERMRVADLLIKSGKYSLEVIAETVGYSTYSGFYSAFIRYYGHSPAEHF